MRRAPASPVTSSRSICRTSPEASTAVRFVRAPASPGLSTTSGPACVTAQRRGSPTKTCTSGHSAGKISVTSWCTCACTTYGIDPATGAANTARESDCARSAAPPASATRSPAEAAGSSVPPSSAAACWASDRSDSAPITAGDCAGAAGGASGGSSSTGSAGAAEGTSPSRSTATSVARAASSGARSSGGSASSKNRPHERLRRLPLRRRAQRLRQRRHAHRRHGVDRPLRRLRRRDARRQQNECGPKPAQTPHEPDRHRPRHQPLPPASCKQYQRHSERRDNRTPNTLLPCTGSPSRLTAAPST